MKFSSILHYIGVLSLFITTLLGGLLWGGNDWSVIFIISSFVLSIIIFFLVRLMIDKKKQTHPNILHQLILWGLYVLIFIGGGFFSLHFLTIQILAGDDLKTNGNDKIDATISMVNEFKTSVQEVKNTLYFNLHSSLEEYVQKDRRSQERLDMKDVMINTYGLSATILDDPDLKSLTQSTAESWIQANYTDKIDNFLRNIEQNISAFYIPNKDVFNTLSFLDKNRVYYSLDTLLINNKERLEVRFNDVIGKYNLSNQAFPSFVVPPTTVSLNSLTDLRSQYNPTLYILFYLIIHILILYPLFLSTRVGMKPLSDHDDTPDLE